MVTVNCSFRLTERMVIGSVSSRYLFPDIAIWVKRFRYSGTRLMPKCPGIIRVSVLSGLSEKGMAKCFISARTTGDISTATKGFFFNVTASGTIISLNLKTGHTKIFL